MTVTLSPDAERLVKERLERGEYRSATDLLDAAVHRLLGEPCPLASAHERSLSESLAGFIGVVDSRNEPPVERRRSAVGELIAEKFRKQGVGRHADVD